MVESRAISNLYTDEEQSQIQEEVSIMTDTESTLDEDVWNLYLYLTQKEDAYNTILSGRTLEREVQAAETETQTTEGEIQQFEEEQPCKCFRYESEIFMQCSAILTVE